MLLVTIPLATHTAPRFRKKKGAHGSRCPWLLHPGAGPQCICPDVHSPDSLFSVTPGPTLDPVQDPVRTMTMHCICSVSLSSASRLGLCAYLQLEVEPWGSLPCWGVACQVSLVQGLGPGGPPSWWDPRGAESRIPLAFSPSPLPTLPLHAWRVCMGLAHGALGPETDSLRP